MFRNTESNTYEKLPKYELLKTSWKYQGTQFFKNSSLHGVSFIGDSKRPFHERFVWFSFVLTGFVTTSVILISLWEKFQTSPTITGLDTDFHNWDVPFPAITLCPKDPTDLQKVENYVMKYWINNTESENAEFYKNFIIQLSNLSYTNLDSIVQFANIDLKSNENLRDLIPQVVSRCEDLFSDCIWKGEPYNCCNGFYPTLTDRGFCYTFNSKQYEWNFWKESNNTKHVPEIRYIYETDNDLYFTFRYENITNNPTTIYIHNNIEKVNQDLYPHHVWYRRIGKIYFEEKQTYTTEDSKQLSIEQRHCVFPDEIKLITDQTYTYTACMTQCRMKMSMTACGCIPFFYDEIGRFKHCTLSGLVCLAKHKDEISRGLKCDCKLSCMNTVYEVITLEDAKLGAIEIFEVSFESWPTIRYKREVLFGWVDLFVSFGGIAGLFLGFSLLSGIETIYYFTLRAFCMVYRDESILIELHKQYESAPKPDIDLKLQLSFMRKRKVTENTKKEQNMKIYVLPYLP